MGSAHGACGFECRAIHLSESRQIDVQNSRYKNNVALCAKWCVENAPHRPIPANAKKRTQCWCDDLLSEGNRDQDNPLHPIYSAGCAGNMTLGCTNTMTHAVVVLDLDGVIVKSNLVKHDAMLSLFADYPDRQASVSSFILANGGVPRRIKLAALLQDYLHIKPTEVAIAGLLDRYAAALASQLAAAPAVEGVEAFIACWPGPRYVCSSAPELEVREQVARRSLGAHFTAIFSGKTPKSDALRQIAAANSERRVVFFGDSIGDYEAAQKADVAFVAVTCERDNFAEWPVVKISNFADPMVVDRAMLAALS